MGHLVAAVLVTADTVLLGAMRPELPLLALLGYALVVGLLVVGQARQPAVGLTVALLLAAWSGGSYLVLLLVGYRTGHHLRSIVDTVVVVAAILGGIGYAAISHPLGQSVATHVAFVVLPLLVGRYFAEHRRLITALDERNRALRRERELVAEQEQLRERLRIARDVHDSLGHRLSVVAMQAGALEMADLPVEQRGAVTALAGSARGAVRELYQVIGSLRGAAIEPEPGTDAVAVVVAEYRTAGLDVRLDTTGAPRRLPARADRAAYRVVAEGLANAGKHAPGQSVTVRLAWEADALVVSVANPLGDEPAAPGAGLGLPSLAERVATAGGFLDHHVDDDGFQVTALLPVAEPEPEPVRRPHAVRLAALTVAAAVVVLGLLPTSLLAGVH
jgi:signal transduction histidine kinase